MVDFTGIEIGRKYTRPALAAKWGYRGPAALYRGVITPARRKLIILFVTRIKQEALTQYTDFLDGSRLHWEGETAGGSDERIRSAHRNGDSIHLFYREIHHSPFEYKGTLRLLHVALSAKGPSKFTFALDHDQSAFDDIQTHAAEFSNQPETERSAIVQARIGQGQFRERLLNLWHGCSVTGITTPALLRASHIKPWRVSSNGERLSQYNGLLLLPSLDHVFDRGLITFRLTGAIEFSPALTEDDQRALALGPGMALRMVPEPSEKFLRFHRKEVFASQQTED